MRILHLGKYYPPAAGGVERFLGDLLEEQRRAGDEAAALVHAARADAVHADPPWVMRCPVFLRLIFAPISPAYPAWLARALRRFGPDVLHIHMPNVSPFWALLLPLARRVPWLVHWHSDVEPSKFKRSLRLAYPHYRIFERALLERAEAIVVSSPQYLAASAPLRPWRHKCHVVPLGISPARLPDVPAGASDALWPSEGMRVLAVGRLTYYKGFDTLVRAVAGAAGMQLVVAGSGDERPVLERILSECGNPDHLVLAGEVDDPTLCRLMASCDVVCLPSRERTEAFGLVLVEAMRYGKPLVVSELAGSGVAYVAREGQNAVTVPVDDVRAWRSALDELAAHPARRHMLGRLGRERYERDFQIARVAALLRPIYRLCQARDAPLPAPPPVAAARDAKMGAGRVLVVIPALNEAGCIGKVIGDARAHPATDVLVVDDGSSDDTVAIALLSGATVLRAPLWQGAWGAIQTGLRYALRHGYDAAITMDADGQHEAVYMPQLLQAGRDADVVIAACPGRGSCMRHVAWRYFRFLTGFAFEDLTSGFRYYNARACRLLASEEATLLDYQDIGVLMLLRRARMRIAEIPVEMNARRDGASRVFFSWWTVARYMAETTLLCLARWNPRQR
jgi:glycosyltransferase involved in cell wall biosynthesis